MNLDPFKKQHQASRDYLEDRMKRIPLTEDEVREQRRYIDGQRAIWTDAGGKEKDFALGKVNLGDTSEGGGAKPVDSAQPETAPPTLAGDEAPGKEA